MNTFNLVMKPVTSNFSEFCSAPSQQQLLIFQQNIPAFTCLSYQSILEGRVGIVVSTSRSIAVTHKETSLRSPFAPGFHLSSGSRPLRFTFLWLSAFLELAESFAIRSKLFSDFWPYYSWFMSSEGPREGGCIFSPYNNTLWCSSKRGSRKRLFLRFPP